MQTTKTSARGLKKTNSPEPLLLDIRPMFARGISPCGTIDQAVANLRANQDLILLAPFEPVPLFMKLAEQGFDHYSEQMADGGWQIRFVRSGPGSASVGGGQTPSCCH